MKRKGPVSSVRYTTLSSPPLALGPVCFYHEGLTRLFCLSLVLKGSQRPRDRVVSRMASNPTVPYINSRISLVAKSGVRYEGILYAIDPKESTVALSNGTSSVHTAGLSFPSSS